MELLEARDESGKLAKAALPSLAKFASDLDIEAPKELKALKDLLDNFTEIKDAASPKNFKAELRPYQIKGFNWLSFLKDNELGGVLADDMGLGKTIQTIAAMPNKTLVIAPTSVIPNWKKEIERFRPSLKVCLFHGLSRRLDFSSDVVITSYGLLRNELDTLKNLAWNMIVLDEAQIIKNPDSQTTKSAFELRAPFKLALSGTPIENSLEDLWSIFQFVNPGLLGSRRYFKDNYVKAILEGAPGPSKRLKKQDKAILLRRLKKEVAKDLPDRIDKVIYADFDKDERLQYESLFLSSKSQVVEKLNQGGKVLEALELLLRLRQSCCHRSLIPGAQAEDSAKIRILKDKLKTIILEDHKALVFSQWTSFLDIIETMLKEEGIDYLRLDGSSNNRQDIVDQFQDETGPKVLIMSLKAGGVGLNLTRADHVFIMDPWWNPAAEDQAADRAHRIGQKNTVMVHPIIVANSIEEKILELQTRKRALAQAVVEDGGASIELTKDDLLGLFN